MSARPPLLRVSNELLLMIYNFCSMPDAARLARTNRQLYNLLNDELYKHNRGEERDMSSLFWGIKKHQINTVRLALENGTDVNLTKREYSSLYQVIGTHIPAFSALHLAVEVGNLEIIQLLLERGADVHIFAIRSILRKPHPAKNNFTMINLVEHEETPLATAFSSGPHKDRVDLLIRYGAYKITPKETALHLAAGYGWHDTVEALLANEHVDPNGRDTLWLTPPLHWISRCVSSELAYKTIKVLVRHGADLDAAGPESPPLHWLTDRGFFAYAHLVLEWGACPDASLYSKYKATPLHLLWNEANCLRGLSRNGDTESEDKQMLMRALIICGNDINAKDMCGATPLFYAIWRASSSDPAIELMEAGANMDVVVDPSHRDEDLSHDTLYSSSPITTKDIITTPYSISVLELLLAKEGGRTWLSKYPRRPPTFSNILLYCLERGARLDVSSDNEMECTILGLLVHKYGKDGHGDLLEKVLDNATPKNIDVEFARAVLDTLRDSDDDELRMAKILSDFIERVFPEDTTHDD